MPDDPEVLLRLPADLRDAFKEPLGPVYDDHERLDLAGTIVAVGDVVSHDAEAAGRVPDVAVIDGRTERTAVDPDIEAALAATDRARLEAMNPAATITRSLLEALLEALDRADPVQVVVEGEEDLAVLPAILAVPDGTHVLYGQPGEGVVHVEVDAAVRGRAEALLDAMDGDVAAVRAILGA